MKRLVPLFLFLILAGCGSKEDLAFLGRWHGNFFVDKIRDGGAEQDRKREGLRGSLQLYATNRSFKLHFEGEQEAIDADGNWSHNGPTTTLKFTTVKIDDQGGANRRDPNLKFIPAGDVHEAFQRNMTLHLSKDKQKLLGLETSIGHLTGHTLFTRSTD